MHSFLQNWSQCFENLAANLENYKLKLMKNVSLKILSEYEALDDNRATVMYTKLSLKNLFLFFAKAVLVY